MTAIFGDPSWGRRKECQCAAEDIDPRKCLGGEEPLVCYGKRIPQSGNVRGLLGVFGGVVLDASQDPDDRHRAGPWIPTLQKSSVPVTSLKVLFAELHRTCVMSSDDKRFWEGPQPHPADEASYERKSYLRRLSRDWAATTLKRMLAKTYDGEV